MNAVPVRSSWLFSKARVFFSAMIVVSLVTFFGVGCVDDDDVDTPDIPDVTDFTPGSQFNPDIDYEIFAYGGQSYRAVKIGDLTWMAENLNYAGADGGVGVCYDNNPGNCLKYGRLYNWAEAMGIAPDSQIVWFEWEGIGADHQGICPVGWRLPNSSDIGDLNKNIADGDSVGNKLKSQVGWNICTDVVNDSMIFISCDNGGTNESGFSALPGGIGGGDFSYAGYMGILWSVTEGNMFQQYSIHTSGVQWQITSHQSHWYTGTLFFPASQFSVRCVKAD